MVVQQEAFFDPAVASVCSARLRLHDSRKRLLSVAARRYPCQPAVRVVGRGTLPGSFFSNDFAPQRCQLSCSPPNQASIDPQVNAGGSRGSPERHPPRNDRAGKLDQNPDGKAGVVLWCRKAWKPRYRPIARSAVTNPIRIPISMNRPDVTIKVIIENRFSSGR
ncbi:hypothetical protein MFFC18_10200 [Mariniblastus fucicola]|uniref:Uncharacterized protein n=1 Tax=Mariniblastus fucicola TaxID=980251 RepID=A0A5B9P953_9BACT|nr:hypothetical protein MFFC18_10200 [Mariniblastus fucicola]